MIDGISIIISVLNEARNISRTLEILKNKPNIEVIVVDGGSEDETVFIAQSFGVKVISTFPGRASQMNTGAAVATGNILLFLHGDTCLPANFEILITAALAKPKIVGGAFKLGIDAKIRGRIIVEKMVNWRSRLFSLPYGDQAIFLKSTIFHQLGGFPNLPLMEDFEFILQLRRLGKIEIVPMAVLTSGRRWEKLGIIRTTLINQLIIIGYLLGISPLKLASWYRKGFFLKCGR